MVRKGPPCGPHDMNDEWLGAGLGVRESGQPKVTGSERKGGMSQREMSCCRGNALGNRPVRDSVASHTSETNPTDLRHAVASRYKNSGQNKPKPSILRVISGLRGKGGDFQEI